MPQDTLAVPAVPTVNVPLAYRSPTSKSPWIAKCTGRPVNWPIRPTIINERDRYRDMPRQNVYYCAFRTSTEDEAIE